MERVWRRISTHGRDRLATSEERRLAGRLNAALWLCGAVTLVAMVPLPGPRVERPGIVMAVAALGLVWGAIAMWLVRWERATRTVLHVFTAFLVLAVAVLQPLTGGPESPTREYLWFVVVYAAFHYPAWAAAAAWLGCSLVSAMPLLYAPGAIEHLVRELFILLPAYAIVGTLVFAGREVLTGLSRRATALGEEQARLAAEQSSLRRVATAVAAGSPPQAIFALVSSEAGRLLDADAARDRPLPRRRPPPGGGRLAGPRRARPGVHARPRRGAVAPACRRRTAAHRPLRRGRPEPRTPVRLPSLRRRAGPRRRRIWGVLTVTRGARMRSPPAPRSGCATTPR